VHAPIRVAAAVIEDASGRILLARRPDRAHQGGLWEFPGGKVEPGEAIGEALRREIAEELGIEVLAHRPLIRIPHAYADRQVVLDVHRVTAYRGQPAGLEGQPLAWADPADLDRYAMPAADRPIVAAVRLPDTYLITPKPAGGPDAFVATLRHALRGGVRLVQLRGPGLPRPVLEPYAAAAAAACRDAGARLLVGRDWRLAAAVGADGVHLAASQLAVLAHRPLPRPFLVGASCHDAAELRRAEALDADFAVLSPVLPTRTHPDAAPLGWDRFAAWVEDAVLPVYALGGMTRELLEQAWQHGAQGVAGIRGLWPDLEGG
jgi:8-oxo-dGTP diphosphatase